MISSSAELKGIFYKNTTVKTGVSAIVEYNMNQMLDNVLVNYSDSLEASYARSDDGKVNLFKKLFPVDAIVRPFRPVNSGVKYYISLPNDITSGSYDDYRVAPYSIGQKPRVYYAGVNNAYKYWVTPENGIVDVTVNYSISTATIVSAYSTGNANTYPNRVVYTTNKPHGFIVGNKVSITGNTANGLNLSNKEITAVPESNKFIVSDTVAATTGTGGTAVLRNLEGTSNISSKPALANKIVVKFEKYHSIPQNFTADIIIEYSDSTQVTVPTVAVPSNGTLSIYYNGTTWSATPSYSSAQPISFANPKEIRWIRVVTPSAGSGKVIGLIEISARWQKDISADIIDFSMQKESSADENSLLPVGFITANSLQMNLARYNQDNLRILTYNRDEDWNVTPGVNNIIYMAKNMEITPYINVFHSSGAVTDGSLKYDRVQQGVFYLDSHEINSYGDTSITALDGAKYLMETVPVNLYLKDAPATAALMCLLDTVGFTNYNFNIDSPSDSSIPNIKLWWTDDQKKTWEHIQEICRDIQMNAFFDENNVLQFYSRNNIYNKSTVDWRFYESNETVAVTGGTEQRLANIIDFSKSELPSANEVKVLWQVPESSLLNTYLEPIWSAPVTFLVAGALRYPISKDTPAELVNLDIDTETIIDTTLSAFSYNGYFLINSEVFEYDAIQYQYMPLDGSALQYSWATSETDVVKIRSISTSDFQKVKPTGKYRVKNRGVFGTPVSDHAANSGENSSWRLIEEQFDI